MKFENHRIIKEISGITMMNIQARFMGYWSWWLYCLEIRKIVV